MGGANIFVKRQKSCIIKRVDLGGVDMIHIAIVETKETAKEIMFQLASLFEEQEWTVQYFAKLSKLAKAERTLAFDVIFFHEKFEIPRVEQSFIKSKPQRIVVYTKTHLTEEEKTMHLPTRIFYVDKLHIKRGFQRIGFYMKAILRNEEEYMFCYNKIRVPLKISSIMYIEKKGKNLVYHTKRGLFQERKSIRDADMYFNKYHFLWTYSSYLVNMQYITEVDIRFVRLQGGVFIPLARSRRADVIHQLHSFVEASK